MTQEELKQKADDLGRKIKEKRQELFKSHWENMAKAFEVPDGWSVDQALNEDLYFIYGDLDRTDWFASEMLAQIGMNGDHDKSHFDCYGGLGHLVCGAPYDTGIFLYAKCTNRATKASASLINNMKFFDRSWGRGCSHDKVCDGKFRYGERFDSVRDDFSNAESEGKLSKLFDESVRGLQALKDNLKWRDSIYPYLHKAVLSMRRREANSSENRISNAEKALDNL